MAIQESGEMYLETILRLSKTKSSVRAIDISEHMGYSKPSVSRAIGLLKKSEYIMVDSEGYITMTAKGEQFAKDLYERHTVLANMLMALGIDEETATEDACRIEHVISEKSFAAVKKHYLNYKK